MQVVGIVVAVLIGVALGGPLVNVADRFLARRDIDPGTWAREIVGLLAGSVLGVFAASFDEGWALAGYSIIGLGLVLLSWIDLRAMWLPGRSPSPRRRHRRRCS